MKIIFKKEALKRLNSGAPVIFQTDTLPAMGCLPRYSDIIYEVKQREKSKALILMGSELSQIFKYVHQNARDDVLKLAKKYWPGALTLVVPISDNLKLNFVSIDNTIGIRVPNSLTAQSFLESSGPLATSSANISGLSTSFSAELVSQDLPNVGLLGPVPWHDCSGQASTIVSWVKENNWQLIRKGQILMSNLQ